MHIESLKSSTFVKCRAVRNIPSRVPKISKFHSAQPWFEAKISTKEKFKFSAISHFQSPTKRDMNVMVSGAFGHESERVALAFLDGHDVDRLHFIVRCHHLQIMR